MSIDLPAATAFMAGHARVLDRRRYDLLLDGPTDAAVAGALAALDAYRNADGGYGWGLEPDLRSPESQPGAALHAFEVLEEIGPATSPRAAELCEWLDGVTRPDGGLPFALPLTSDHATAPWWAGADTTTSSLQITAVTAAMAHRVARRDPAVRGHPWLARATAYCVAAIEALTEQPHAYVLSFAVRFADAVEDAALIERLGQWVPASGELPVAGGTESEKLRPLDLSPLPGLPSRALLDDAVIARDLDRLAAEQHDDGGWSVDYARISDAGALDWSGYITHHAVRLLRANERA